MLKTVLWAIALIGGLLASPALSQTILSASSPEEFEVVTDNWTKTRVEIGGRMARAQAECSPRRYEDAQDDYIDAVTTQIGLIDMRLKALQSGTAAERARDADLAIALLFERERLTATRKAAESEEYQSCGEDDEDDRVQYVKVCGEYGAGFFYIPGTETCLRVGGYVRTELFKRTISEDVSVRSAQGGFQNRSFGGPASYDFQWGNRSSGDGAVPFQVTFDTYYNNGGTVRRGAFATETATIPQTLVVPGYNFDANYGGYGVTGKLSTELSFGGFSKVLLSGALGVDYTSAQSSATNQQFLQGFGIPGVSSTPGFYINSPTDMLRFDFWSNKRQSELALDAGIPLSGGVNTTLPDHPIEYSIDALARVRTGMFTQTERMLATLDTPAFGVNSGSTVEYNTTFDGMHYGASGGIGFRAQTPIGSSELFLQKEAAFRAGFSLFNLTVNDTLDATLVGGAPVSRTNSFNVTATLPSVSLNTSLGIGNDKFTASILAGASYGETANIDYQRLDNGQNPTVNVQPAMSYSGGIRIQARF